MGINYLAFGVVVPHKAGLFAWTTSLCKILYRINSKKKKKINKILWLQVAYIFKM